MDTGGNRREDARQHLDNREHRSRAPGTDPGSGEKVFREDPPPPRVHAILDEQVLYRSVGGPAAMAEQLDHLIELAMMPRISIQVIPADRPHAGLLGAFVVAETDQPPAIVYLDSALDGQVVESPAKAEAMDVVFRALQMEALTGSASLNKMKEAEQRWKEQITP
jgi:hypothetical protein